ncbi:MAG: hypothetical protein HOI86_12395 [Tateyamaria sp.]|nr:hypothetical protein [Tateyamaria sp.]
MTQSNRKKRWDMTVSYNWLNESYRVTSSGGLFYNDGYKERPIACDAGQIAERFLGLNGSKIRQRFETAMKDKRYESNSAYTKDVEQKLGRSSVFLICDVK